MPIPDGRFAQTLAWRPTVLRKPDRARNAVITKGKKGGYRPLFCARGA